jgi:uncharacterized iron-regulated membrane protein
MPVPFRKALFWLHLTTALLAGLVILVMSGTGLLLAFEAQLQALADGGSRYVEPVENIPAASLEGLLGTLREQRGELGVSAVTVRRDPREAVSLALGREGVLYLDPYRRVATGQGSTAVRAGFRTVTEIHRFLAAQGDARSVGKAVTGGASLVFLVILVSGLYIWIPRAASWLQVRNAVWFRRGLAAKARDFNWHHVLGIWALLPLLVVVASALPISYPWAGNLIQALTGSPPAPVASAVQRPANAAAPGAAGSGPAESSPRLAELDLAGLDRAIAVAKSAEPSWQAITVRLPAQPDGTLSVIVDNSPRRGRPDLRAQLTVAAGSGQVVKHGRFAEQDRGRRVRSWMRWLHTGEAGGLPGQAVGALACAAVLVLGWTGYALVFRRFSAWLRSRPARVGRLLGAAAKPGPRVVTPSSSMPHFPPEV